MSAKNLRKLLSTVKYIDDIEASIKTQNDFEIECSRYRALIYRYLQGKEEIRPILLKMKLKIDGFIKKNPRMANLGLFDNSWLHH